MNHARVTVDAELEPSFHASGMAGGGSAALVGEGPVPG